MKIRLLLLALLILPLLTCSVVGAEGQGPRTTAVDFVRDIQPLLRQRCQSCHGDKKQRGGLRLDNRKAALQGGDSGPAFVPGKAAQSTLLRRVTSQDPTDRMPPKGEPLSAQQMDLLRTWIDQGAPWPAVAGSEDAQKMHWAFQPVVRPALPRVRDASWGRNPVDRFILARLEKEQLSPAPEADRRTLLRRLSFDLIGLPPTPAELAEFLADSRPDAYEQLVERLLASPHYGERWARHWLDVVRFAESHGFEMNQPRPNAWPYRDYVIRAFNEDRPYDRFVREQLAGDSVAADAALGFLVGGPWDQVKSPDPVLTAQQRADELHDMVSTTGSAFLGLTVGCARCHNHKFDPISQADYYSLTAVFAGVQHGERTLRAEDTEHRQRESRDLHRQLALLDASLAPFRPPVSPAENEERFEAVAARFVRFTVLQSSDAEPCLDELEVFRSGTPECNVALAAAGTRATASGTLPGFAIHQLKHVNDGCYGNERSWISNEKGRGWVQLELPRTERIDRVVWSRDRSGRPGAYADRLATDYRIEVSLDGRQWRTVASSSDRLPMSPSAVPNGKQGTPAQAAQIRETLARRIEIENRLRQLRRGMPIYAGQMVQPGPTRRLYRGDPMQPREQVHPGAVAALGHKLQLGLDTPEQQRRRALADWITDPHHPLTARVMVNRLWHYHFGEGLVSTPSDFGINGARPSHPELLDWLASEFVARGWSIKQIHRLIVLSATYRQASQGSSRGPSVDGASRLLWRYPPHRLEAETLRDTILAVCGNLDRRMGGPGFDLFEPNSNYVKVYTAKTRLGPPEWRRMVYQMKPRMQLDGVFGAFDCPDAGQIAPKRTRSTTPLQALNLLNSPFLLQQAEIFAGRLQREAGSSPHAQVSHAFRLAFSRDPDPEELATAVALIRAEGLVIFCRALLNANELLYVS